MSIYKELAKTIDADDLRNFYSNHLPTETCRYFNIPNQYLLHQILKYYNIPKHTPAENTRIQFDNMSDEEKLARGKKIGTSNLGRVVSSETRDRIAKKQEGVPKPPRGGTLDTMFKPGHIPWNKDKVGVQHWTEGQAEKRYQTMLKNGTIGQFKTNIEKKVEQELIDQYGEEHVHYQYYDKERYPFRCDFYVDSVDLFVEVNGWWHHGPHPYDPNSVEDEDILNDLRWYAETHPDKKQYKEAIRIWTEYDPLKMKTAKVNNLNYLTTYN